MSTLADTENWLAKTLGDTRRARSLVQVMRKNGLFLASKRNVTIMSDYAHVAMAALYTGGPTKLPEYVPIMGDLELVSVTLDDNDGNPKTVDPMQADVDLLKEWFAPFDVSLAVFFGGNRDNFYARLVHLFFPKSPTRRFHLYDGISVEQSGDAFRGTITLAEDGHGVGYSGFSEHGPGHRAVTLHFENDAVFDPGRQRTKSEVPGLALDGLAQLTVWLHENKTKAGAADE